jgi:hypothetical protein
MNKNAFLNLLNDGHAKMVALTKSKGEEYSSSDDQLGNFRRLAEQTGLTMPQIWLVLFTKHIDAIRTFIKDEAAGVQRERSEPIEGRIDDAILYLYLLRGIVGEEKQAQRDEFRHAVAVLKNIENPPPLTAYFSSAATVTLGVQAPHRARAVVPNAAHYQRIDHPDALHGVPHGSAFVWVGAADSRCEEYRAKCLRLGVRFFMATAEYADDKFGG